MKFRLAMVTGASSGIGEALCYLLASKGIPLIITGRNQKALDTLAAELSSRVKVEVFALDLSISAHRQQLIDQIHILAPDLVVNNAGFGLYGEALSFETSIQVEMLQVNCQAVLEFTLEAARTMVSVGQKGVVLNVSSSAGFLPFPSFAVYAATKAFVNSFSESLDEELKTHGVRVLATCPGMVVTKFRQRASGGIFHSIPKIKKRSFKVMSASFAAEQIWAQIEKQKPIYIFNWFYRTMIFAVRYLLPKKIVMEVIKTDMKKRYKPRPFIMINNIQDKK